MAIHQWLFKPKQDKSECHRNVVVVTDMHFLFFFCLLIKIKNFLFFTCIEKELLRELRVGGSDMVEQGEPVR